MNIHEVKAKLEGAAAPIVKVIHKTDSNRIIALGLKKGITLKEHTASVSAKLIIMEGKAAYRQGEETIVLNKYDEHEIPVNVPHSVEGLEDTVAILIH